MQVKSFSIGLGAQMQIQLAGMSVSLKCQLVGLETDQYLLVRVPIMSGVLNRLHEGNRATVRCVYAGTVYGFYCVVLNHVIKPAPLAFLTYPSSFEILNLRKAERVDCFVSVAIAIGEIDYQGVILDISADGCKFVVESTPRQGMPQVQMGESVKLTFELSNAVTPLETPGIIKNLTQDIHRMTLGVSFEQPSDSLREAIDGFVGKVLSYR
jgi:c-di-GMP-binding flagellar brake protein YcgR